MVLDSSLLARAAARTDLFQRVFAQMTPAECVRALSWAGLIERPVRVPSYLTAESTLTHLHWNNGQGSFYQTTPNYRYAGGVFTQNRTAADVRSILRQLFERSPAAFLAAIVDDARGSELIRLSAAKDSGTPARTTIVCWDKDRLNEALIEHPGLDLRGNVVVAEHAYDASGDGPRRARDIARILAGRPPGLRVIKVGQSLPLWKIYYKHRFCFFDREFDTPRRHGLGVERWYRSVRAKESLWRRFWRALREAGEKIRGPGKGDEICDRLILDAENYRLFWKYRPESISKGYGYEGGETLDDIFADPDWPQWRSRIPRGSPLPQDVWNSWKSWDVNTDERVFLFDACMRQYLSERLAGLIRVAKDYFPKLQAFEYTSCVGTSGTHPSDRATDAALKPYGTGAIVGGSAIYCYGEFDRARWYWPRHAEQRWDGRHSSFDFAALFTQLTRLANLLNGTSHQRFVFLTCNELAGPGGNLGHAGYWAELICHAALLCGDSTNVPGGGIHFYQAGDKASAAAHRHFCDLVAERDEVVADAAACPIPPPPMDDYNQGLLVSSLVAGGKRIYRVTPNRLFETAVNQSAAGVEFANKLQSLRIDGGRLHPRSQSPLAPLGWWVVQPLENQG
jgi:hypothetical protein